MKDVHYGKGTGKNSGTIPSSGLDGPQPKTRRQRQNPRKGDLHRQTVRIRFQQKRISIFNLICIDERRSVVVGIPESGVVVSDSPFFNEVFEGIHEKCSQLHYTLSIQYLYDREQAQAALRGNKADGIILLGTEMAAEDYQPFEQCPVPIVVLDTYFETVQVNYVLINNTQGAYQATGFLIKRCMSQPGYLRSAYPIGNFNERANGFYQAIRDYGMSPSKSVVHLLSPAPDGAYADMCCLLEQQEELACCYFADNDAIACAAMRALQEHGYRIPEDISIIGFDDIPVCGYVIPALTTVRVSKRYLGNTAVSHLIRLMEEKTNVCCKIEISTELVVRGSVR